MSSFALFPCSWGVGCDPGSVSGSEVHKEVGTGPRFPGERKMPQSTGQGAGSQGRLPGGGDALADSSSRRRVCRGGGREHSPWKVRGHDQRGHMSSEKGYESSGDRASDKEDKAWVTREEGRAGC